MLNENRQVLHELFLWDEVRGLVFVFQCCRVNEINHSIDGHQTFDIEVSQRIRC